MELEEKITRRLVAAFESRAALEAALDALRAARIEGLQTYTPAPPVPEGASPRVSIVSLVAGLAGAAGMYAMQVYANLRAYPLDIGGRPKFSWPSFAPIAFEVGILFAVISIVVCVFIFARLMRLHAPIDNCSVMRRALSDRWVIAVKSADPETRRMARRLCESFGAREIEDFGNDADASHSASFTAAGL